jgi:hypothetical protein
MIKKSFFMAPSCNPSPAFSQTVPNSARRRQHRLLCSRNNDMVRDDHRLLKQHLTYNCMPVGGVRQRVALTVLGQTPFFAFLLTLSGQF